MAGAAASRTRCAYSRGNTNGEYTAPIQFQFLDDLNLEDNEGPTDRDRRHNLVISGRAEVPHTFGMTLAGTLRMMSGLPFTIINTATDPDRNGVLFDPLPAGEYSGNGANAITVDNDGGRNGAYGPGFIQLDMRFGWRWHMRGQPDSRPVARPDQPDQSVELPQPDRREHPERRGSTADQLPAADPVVGRWPAAPSPGRRPVRVLASQDDPPADICRDGLPGVPRGRRDAVARSVPARDVGKFSGPAANYWASSL